MRDLEVFLIICYLHFRQALCCDSRNIVHRQINKSRYDFLDIHNYSKSESKIGPEIFPYRYVFLAVDYTLALPMLFMNP